jgi:hypothetical protein
VRSGEIPAPPDDPPLIVGDVRRLRGELGWEPRYGLEEGLDDTVTWWSDALVDERSKPGGGWALVMPTNGTVVLGGGIVLVSMLPLPVLIGAGEDVPEDAREATALLRCSELLLVDTAASHPTRREEAWIYVYDEDKYSTRFSLIDWLSPNNCPTGTRASRSRCTGRRTGPCRRIIRQLAEG